MYAPHTPRQYFVAKVTRIYHQIEKKARVKYGKMVL
jgi:hypothetical protein